MQMTMRILIMRPWSRYSSLGDVVLRADLFNANVPLSQHKSLHLSARAGNKKRGNKNKIEEA